MNKQGVLECKSMGEDYTISTRPAFVMNRSSVLFICAASSTGDKSSEPAGNGKFGEFMTSSNSGQRKLTILGSAAQRDFSAALESASVTSGGNLTVSYSNAVTGNGYCVSAMLCDSTGNVIGYASITPDSSGSGTWDMTLPTLTNGTYTLNVFSEQQNKSYHTDYASPMIPITLTVVGNPVTTYSVNVNKGSGMTKTSASGSVNQAGLTGAMADVIFKADDGYYFSEDYSVAAVNGIIVLRDSASQITVSGTPTADVTLNLPAATLRNTDDTPSKALGERPDMLSVALTNKIIVKLGYTSMLDYYLKVC